MPALKYVGNAGRYRLTNSDVDVAQGETVTVDEETAAYLQEHGEFEAVEDTDDDGEEAAAEAETSPDAADAPIDPSGYTVGELEAAIDDGDFSDEELQAIRAAEAQDQNRKGVRGALDTRLED